MQKNKKLHDSGLKKEKEKNFKEKTKEKLQKY